MAPVRGYAYRPQPKPAPKPAEKPQTRLAKENVPPSREKKHVSTSVLFRAAATAPNRVRKPIATNTAFTIIPQKLLASSKKADPRKSILTKRLPEPSPPPAPPKPSTHPLLAKFNGSQCAYKTPIKPSADIGMPASLDTYRDNIASRSSRALDPAHDDLVERLAISGPDTLPADFDRAMDLSSVIGQPFGEQQIRVRFRDSKGHISDGHISLGESVPRFAEMVEGKKTELQALWQEWDEVRQEIAELGAELLDDPSFPAQFGLEPLDHAVLKTSATREGVSGEIAGLRDQVVSVCEQSRKVLRKEAQEDVQSRKAKRDQWLDLLKNES